MNKVTLLFVATASILMAPAAEAQFGGLKDAVGSVKGSEETAAPAGVSQETIVQNFVAANELVHESNAVLLEALGDKERAAAVREEAASFSTASTEGDKDALEGSMVLGEETSDFIASKIAEGAEISAEGRAKYADGLVLAIEGLMATKGLAGDAQAFSASAQDQIKSASIMQKAKVTKKLEAGMFVAKELPGFTSRLTENFSNLMAFAKSADIPTPDDATQLLSAL